MQKREALALLRAAEDLLEAVNDVVSATVRDALESACTDASMTFDPEIPF